MVRGILFSAVMFFLLSAVSWAGDTGFEFRVITAEDLKAELEDRNNKIYLYDARPAKEYVFAHLPGAVNISPEKVSEIAMYLPKNKDAKLVFYCRGYHCNLSQNAAMKALSAGYMSIRLFRGGYPEWAQKGYKVVSGDAP